jgi:hypothetical protein
MSCRYGNWRVVGIDQIRGEPVKARMRSLGIAEDKVAADRGARFADCFVGFQIDLLVFDRPP